MINTNFDKVFRIHSFKVVYRGPDTGSKDARVGNETIDATFFTKDRFYLVPSIFVRKFQTDWDGVVTTVKSRVLKVPAGGR